MAEDVRHNKITESSLRFDVQGCNSRLNLSPRAQQSNKACVNLFPTWPFTLWRQGVKFCISTVKCCELENHLPVITIGMCSLIFCELNLNILPVVVVELLVCQSRQSAHMMFSLIFSRCVDLRNQIILPVCFLEPWY